MCQAQGKGGLAGWLKWQRRKWLLFSSGRLRDRSKWGAAGATVSAKSTLHHFPRAKKRGGSTFAGCSRCCRSRLRCSCRSPRQRVASHPVVCALRHRAHNWILEPLMRRRRKEGRKGSPPRPPDILIRPPRPLPIPILPPPAAAPVIQDAIYHILLLLCRNNAAAHRVRALLTAKERRINSSCCIMHALPSIGRASEAGKIEWNSTLPPSFTSSSTFPSSSEIFRPSIPRVVSDSAAAALNFDSVAAAASSALRPSSSALSCGVDVAISGAMDEVLTKISLLLLLLLLPRSSAIILLLLEMEKGPQDRTTSAAAECISHDESITAVNLTAPPSLIAQGRRGVRGSFVSSCGGNARLLQNRGPAVSFESQHQSFSQTVLPPEVASCLLKHAGTVVGN